MNEKNTPDAAVGAVQTMVEICPHLAEPGARVVRGYHFHNDARVFLCADCVRNIAEYAEVQDIPLAQLLRDYPEAGPLADAPLGMMRQAGGAPGSYTEHPLAEDDD